MEVATKKLEIIKLVLSLENQEILDFLLAYLQAQNQSSIDEKPAFSDEESDELLARYNQKIADVQTDKEMKTVLTEFTEEEQFSIVLMLRAKEARENRHLATEASEFFSKRREQRKQRKNAQQI